MPGTAIEKITSREQADVLLAEHARTQRDIAHTGAWAMEECARITKEAADENAPLIARRDEIEKLLRQWFRREEKTLGGERSIKLPSGNIGHRDGPPRIEFLEDWNEEAALKAMQGRERWEQFIRRGKDSIDKRALLAATELHGDPLRRVGMRIGKSKDEFYIDHDPADTKERVG